jgi:hypothetical protein
MRGRRRAHLAVAVACSAALTLSYAGSVAATIFSYQVDRFELDGNPRGPMDGTLDFVDDFNGTDPSPNWYRAYGTVTEHDGSLFLTDPGTAFPNPDGQLTDLSIASSAYPYVQDGSGNFTATAYWVPLLPPAGHHYHFSIYTFGNVQYFNEIVGLGFLGLGDGRYAIEQHVTEINLAQGIYHNLVSVQHPIDAADLTRNLGMRLAFDDATNMVTTSFSLDGGATWQSPFDPASVFNGRTSAQFILSADPLSDGTSSPTTTVTTTSTSSTTTSTIFPPGPCDATGCRRGVVPLKSTLRMKSVGFAPFTVRTFNWRWNKGAATTLADVGDPMSTTAYEVCIGDGTGTTLATSALVTGAVCPSCWKKVGTSGFRYKTGNYGLDTARLRTGQDGRAAVSVVGAHTVAVGMELPLTTPITVRLRNSDGQCWASVFAPPNVKVGTTSEFRAVE